jgi:hypothetical protein
LKFTLESKLEVITPMSDILPGVPVIPSETLFRIDAEKRSYTYQQVRQLAFSGEYILWYRIFKPEGIELILQSVSEKTIDALTTDLRLYLLKICQRKRDKNIVDTPMEGVQTEGHNPHTVT